MKKSLILLSFLALPVLAADSGVQKSERSITVQGQGKVSAIPDIATLSIDVSHDGPDMDAVLTQVRQEMNRVMEAVKGQGVEDKDIRTDSFQVHPKYEQDRRGNPRPIGYTVANRLSVKVRDLKKTGKILSATLRAGATSVNGPNFEIDNPQIVERLALAAATREAKAKAQAVAEAAGVQLGDILSINPQNVGWPGPRPMMMRAMAAPASAEMQEPIAAGEQTLTGYVTITFSIR